MADAALAAARTNPHTARMFLELITYGCKTLDRYERKRASLCRIGIPPEFLPTAAELGRLDLIPAPA